jgi:coronin-7
MFCFSGSSLAVLAIDDCGRKSKTMPLLHAHTDTVTDMDFSPFHDGLLATGSQDCLVSNCLSTCLILNN